MKIAVIGSRNLTVDDLGKYIPSGCKKIVSGGAIGIDKCAVEYARRQGIELLELFPDYKKYGKAAAVFEKDAKLLKNTTNIIYDTVIFLIVMLPNRLPIYRFQSTKVS